MTLSPSPNGSPRACPRLSDAWRACVDPAWIADWRPRPFALPGGETQIVEMGRREGPTLVLLPPLPGIKEAWVAVAWRLAQSFRIVTFDLRDRFAGPPRWETLLDDVDRIVAATAPGAFGLVGHSMGGALAQQWTLAHPERVRALVLSSSFTRVTDPIANWYARYLEQPVVIASQRLLPLPWALALARAMARRGAWVYDRRCDDRMLAFVRLCMRDCRLATARSAVRLLYAHDTSGSIERIACPTLVVVGERESVFARPAAAELGRRIPGATFAVSPGVSHLHPLTSPEWLATTITSWWERVTSEETPRAGA